MRKVIVFVLCLMLIAMPAFAEQYSSNTGLFTYECPENCIPITGEFIDAMLNGDMSDYLQSGMGELGFDESALDEVFENIKNLDLSNMDFIYTTDMSGNVNMFAQMGLGVTPDMLPMLVSMLDEQMVSTYAAMGVPEESVESLGIQEIGGTQFYVIYVEMSGGLSMHQYMAFNEDGDQIMITFSNFPAEDEQALVESIELL